MANMMTSRLITSNIGTSLFRRGMKIYTKTGDGGTSSLFTGERRAKSDDIFHALGNIDELNSYLGLANNSLKQLQINNNKLSNMAQTLIKTQSVLLDVGSNVATPTSSANERQSFRVRFNGDDLTLELEVGMDEMTQDLPPLKNFILPGGSISSCHLHICRSICRRAERSLEPLLRHNDLAGDVVKYVNRLSDYLFTAARFASYMEGVDEVVYKKAKEVKQ